MATGEDSGLVPWIRKKLGFKTPAERRTRLDTVPDTPRRLDTVPDTPTVQEQLARDLWEAVSNEDVSKVRSVLKQGANPNHQLYWNEEWCDVFKKNRRPPVHHACWRGYLEITRALVSGGADIEKGSGGLGVTAFHYACWGGDMETVVYLSQEMKCRIDARDKEDQTPLYWACWRGHIQVVKYLVEVLKVDVDVTNDNGETPLDWAVRYRSTEVIDYLKSHQPSTPEPDTLNGSEQLLSNSIVDKTSSMTSDPLSGQQTPSAGNKQPETTDTPNGSKHISTSKEGPNPINIQNRTYLKKLDELMADTSGTIELHYLKTHFIGPSGLGKTTTRQRLVGSITNLSLLPEDQRKRCSTLLAECEQVLAFVDKSGTKLEFKASSSLEEETQFIFSYLMSCEPIEDSTVSPPKEQPTKETTDPKKQTQLKIDEAATAPKETVSPTPGQTPEPPKKVGKVTTVDVEKVVSRLRSIVGSGEYTKELLNKVLLNLVDIGGQPGFVEMFPFLSKGAGIFLVFFRLDKDLDDMCQVSYERGKDKITPYDSTYTNRETLSQILSGINHHTKIDSDIDREQCSKLGNLGSTKPVATLIGTFKDELAMQIKVDLLYEKYSASTKAVCKSDSTTASKSLEEHEQKKAIRDILTQKKSDKQANVSAEDTAAIEQTISQNLNSDPFNKCVQDRLEQKLTEKNEAVSTITSKFEDLLSNPKDKKFIAVDNYEGTDSDMEPLREHLHGLFSSYFKDAKLRIRPQQLLFGVVLRKEYDIVSMEECIRIGTEGLKMREEEVRFTVWYLDRYVGALIYHPEIKDKWFGNFVICNPQVVFNSLSVLVVNPLLELHSKESSIHFKEAERKNWILKGQFSLKTITRCHSEENQGVKKDQLIPVEKLLILLEHSHLLAKITAVVKEAHTTEKIETTYFIPAILKCASPEELTKPPPTGIDTPSPIKITFDPQYVPTGIFCAMISDLVSRGSKGKGILGMTWKLATDSPVKRNLVSFHIDESAKHFVTLISHVDSYEIRIIRKYKDHTMHELCSYVLSTLLLVMKDISPLLTPIIAFDCYCGKHEDSSKLCLLTTGVDPCFNCTHKVSLSPHQECWFAKEVSLGHDVTLLALPFAEDLDPSLTFKWRKRCPKICGTGNELEFKASSNGHFKGFISCEISKNQKPFFTVYHCLRNSIGNAVTPLATPHTTTQSGGLSAEDHPSKTDQTVEIPKLFLTGADIQIIRDSLKNASKDWFDLGLALGMNITDLKDIEDQHASNKRRLTEMVVKRLEVTDPEHPMTWPYICECLRRPTVERNDVAEEIEDKYVRTATAVAHSATN
ncbi:uncharacterized protein LOC135352115 isoform X2 [Halichondria panicea]|uniref:uncharacterized protein LOC135352115 isoform X2 n=1 Tax=Halichondria panicea TaxID=6063 RepID=UPI00312BADDD